MKALALLLLLVALFAVSVLGSDDPSTHIPGILDLTPSNFDAVVDGSKHVFVEFYAPWCGYCKRLVPDLIRVAETVSGYKADDLVIAKVNADEYKDLGSRFGVTGFPTIKFFKKGSTSPVDFQGGRTAEEIVEYLAQQTGYSIKMKVEPTNVVDLSPSNFDKIVLDDNKHVLVEFFAPWCGHCKALAPVYEQLANTFKADSKKVVIAKVNADKYRDLASRFDVGGFPTLKFFSPGSKNTPVNYEGERTLKAFVDYINEKAGTRRLESGRLSDKAGRTPELDSLAQAFLVATVDQDSFIKQVSALDGPEKEQYVRVMQKIVEKGKKYVTDESARLTSILQNASGSLTAEKVDEFQTKLNVLQAFQ